MTNVGTERVRVLRFAGYHEADDRWMISTVTGDHYSAEEFRSWYGAGAWIAPGESVTDANNYGSVGGLWAYECETESGTRFMSGAIVT